CSCCKKFPIPNLKIRCHTLACRTCFMKELASNDEKCSICNKTITVANYGENLDLIRLICKIVPLTTLAREITIPINITGNESSAKLEAIAAIRLQKRANGKEMALSMLKKLSDDINCNCVFSKNNAVALTNGEMALFISFTSPDILTVFSPLHEGSV